MSDGCRRTGLWRRGDRHCRMEQRATGSRKRDVGTSWLDPAVWVWPSTGARAVTVVSPRALTTSDVGTFTVAPPGSKT